MATQSTSIDIHEGDKLNTTAFKALIRAAVALNTAKKSQAGGRTAS